MTRYRALWILPLFALLVIAGCTGCGGDKGDGPTPPPGNSIVPLNGLIFKGTMGSGTFDKAMQFAVTDTNGDRVVGQTIQIDPVSGDGSGFDRSIITDAAGVATARYSFTGVLPYASLRLYVPDVDTVTAQLRANAILPGVHGQVAYVGFDDNWATVHDWLGDPVSVDHPPYPDNTIIYVNYESTLGVVVMIYDLDRDGILYDTSSVYGVIVNTVYPGTTTGANPIGIGSTLADLRTRFGAPDFVRPGEPDTVEYAYQQYGITGFAYAPVSGDTILTEMHFTENAIQPDHIVAVNGLYYTGTMGNFISNPVLEFKVENADNVAIGGATIYLSRIEGDGGFLGLLGSSPDEMLTDASNNGIATFRYNFNGLLGHAIMRLTVPNVDTMDVYIRANTLIPGTGGQGQYILFDDTYDWITRYNGQPTSIDTSGLFGADYIYANYANLLGVTFALRDADHNRQVYDSSSVYGVIIDTAYTGMTTSGIGIGSTIGELRSAYNAPSSVVTLAADTVRISYDALMTQFDAVASGADTSVVRILMHE